jgi:hypothetical protein
MPERERILIYPWSFSVTRRWDPENGMSELRDRTYLELVDWLRNQDFEMQSSAITEIALHGNPHKAAEYTRAMIKINPDFEALIRKRFGKDGVDYLTKIPLHKLPENPHEYGRNYVVEYVL